MMQRVEKTFAGRRLVVETGRMAKQASGSALVQFGDTMVLAAVTVSDTQSPLSFFPLLVEYREKTYAAGKIPGGFIKREGRPSDNEILSARIIDRSIRPLFPEGFKNEVQVFIYVISADQENDADVLALVAASFALNASKIPFTTPIAAVRVGRIQEKWVLNPTFQQLAYSDMELVIAGSQESIVMVEGGALEVQEADVIEAITVGHTGIKELIGIQEELLEQMDDRPKKMSWTKATPPDGLEATVKKLADGKIKEAINQKDKHTRIEAVEKVKKNVAEQLLADFPDNAKDLGALIDDCEYNQLRGQVLDSGYRVDGRKPNEVRPSRSTPRCSRARTARRCSPVARRRRSSPQHSALPMTFSAWTRLTKPRKPPSPSCSITTFPRSPRGKFVPCAARHAARLGMATWPSVHCKAFCRRSRSFRIPSASYPTCSSRTARRRWRRSAVARSLCSMPASPCAAPLPASRWG